MGGLEGDFSAKWCNLYLHDVGVVRSLLQPRFEQLCCQAVIPLLRFQNSPCLSPEKFVWVLCASPSRASQQGCETATTTRFHRYKPMQPGCCSVALCPRDFVLMVCLITYWNASAVSTIRTYNRRQQGMPTRILTLTLQTTSARTGLHCVNCRINAQVQQSDMPSLQTNACQPVNDKMLEHMLVDCTSHMLQQQKTFRYAPLCDYRPNTFNSKRTMRKKAKT